MRRLFLIISVLTTFEASAIIGMGFSSAPDQDIVDAIRDYRENHRSIPYRSQCEEILRAASNRLGRPMTGEEIGAAIESILQVTGESLTAISGVPCFTFDTKILTPTGEKLIADLRVGDEVLSVNPNSKTVELVTNTVRESFRLQHSMLNKFYGTPSWLTASYSTRGWALPKKRWTFNLSEGRSVELTGSEKGYFLYAEAEDWVAKKQPTLFRIYERSMGTHGQTPSCIDLSGEPYNMIVNGVLLQSTTR